MGSDRTVIADRIVAVRALLADGRWQVGSGYLVSADVVVTARHCTVNKATGAAALKITVHRESDGRSVPVDHIDAAVDLDVAALGLRAPLTEAPCRLPRYARVDRGAAGELIDCVAVGYPMFQLDPIDGRRNAAELHGTIRQLETPRVGCS